MGYDLHITRRDFWADNGDGVPITLDDWKQYIATDPEMRLDGYAEATTTSGDSVRMEMEGIAVWTKHSQNGIDGNMAWIYHTGDRIVAKNPDEEMIGKMCRIASLLNAKVQGDDGETYAEDGTIVNTDGSSIHSTSCAEDEHRKSMKPWWKIW